MNSIGNVHPTIQKTLHEVSRSCPCPACGRPTWCGATDDQSLIRCMRSTDAPAGYKTVRTYADGGTLFGLVDGETKPIPTPKRKARPRPDFEAMHKRFRGNVEPGFIADIADAWLELSGEALDALAPGWDFEDETLIFPERDADGTIIGLTRRYADGRKKAIQGSRRGLSMPWPLPDRDPVLIVEGPSDTAAALDAGFNAVGRPSNRSGGEMLAELLAGRDVVVMGENDMKQDGRWPGKEGVQAITDQLVDRCKSVETTFPPADYKDARAWLGVLA